MSYDFSLERLRELAYLDVAPAARAEGWEDLLYQLDNAELEARDRGEIFLSGRLGRQIRRLEWSLRLCGLNAADGRG